MSAYQNPLLTMDPKDLNAKQRMFRGRLVQREIQRERLRAALAAAPKSAFGFEADPIGPGFEPGEQAAGFQGPTRASLIAGARKQYVQGLLGGGGGDVGPFEADPAVVGQRGAALVGSGVVPSETGVGTRRTGFVFSGDRGGFDAQDARLRAASQRGVLPDQYDRMREVETGENELRAAEAARLRGVGEGAVLTGRGDEMQGRAALLGAKQQPKVQAIASRGRVKEAEAQAGGVRYQAEEEAKVKREVAAMNSKENAADRAASLAQTSMRISADAEERAAETMARRAAAGERITAEAVQAARKSASDFARTLMNSRFDRDGKQFKDDNVEAQVLVAAGLALANGAMDPDVVFSSVRTALAGMEKGGKPLADSIIEQLRASASLAAPTENDPFADLR